MDNYWTRLSNLITWYLVALFLCGAFSYGTGQLLFAPSTSTAEIHRSTRVTDFGRGRRLGSDLALLHLDMSMDFSKAFNWNTKQLFALLAVHYKTGTRPVNQVVVWDRIMRNAADAQLAVEQASKYYFNEYGRGHLFGSNATLTLDFMYMPKSGFYHKRRRLATHSLRFPLEYKNKGA